MVDAYNIIRGHIKAINNDLLVYEDYMPVDPKRCVVIRQLAINDESKICKPVTSETFSILCRSNGRSKDERMVFYEIYRALKNKKEIHSTGFNFVENDVNNNSLYEFEVQLHY